MLTHEIKFITNSDTLLLKKSDYLSFKYEIKKKTEQNIFDVGKRSYCERRGGHWRSPCSRQLKQLESKIRDQSIVFCDFTHDSIITLIFSTGAIVYLTVKINSLDITRVLFDRYCIGKISSQAVTAVALTKAHWLFVHVDRTATLLTFGKTTTALPYCLSDREPHVQSIELGGTSRRTERKLSYFENNNQTYVLIWSTSSTEPAPWSPVLEDLANLHLYKINGQQVLLLAYHQLENETLLAEVSQNPETIHIVEQLICHENGVSISWVRYGIPTSASRLSSCLSSSSSSSLPAPARDVTRQRNKLLLACIDGSLHIVHSEAGLTHTTKSGFIVSDVRWAGELAVTTDDCGRLQCFDHALSSLHHHTKFFDLSANFNEQKKFQILSTKSVANGVVKIIMCSGGPIALLRISHPKLLTEWLRLGRTSNAVSLLRALDWAENGPECFSAMIQIVNKAMAGGQANESAAESAIGAYMAPLAPHSHAAKKFAQPVYKLARKFFHHLLRRGRIEKALSLAVDLEAWDLFVDARWAAQRYQIQHLADEAAALAAYYVQFERQDSVCSGSCSQCSSRSYSGSDDETSTSSEPDKVKPPPLPRLPTKFSQQITTKPPQPSLTKPSQSAVMKVPTTQADPTPTNAITSIRPNLHQYIDRDSSLWTKIENERLKTNLKWTDNILSNQLTTISEVPKTYPVDHTNYRNVYKNFVPNTLNRYSATYLTSASLIERTYEKDRKQPEKNKVKFSDTVTVAVVAKEPSMVPEVERELADSLPLCPPDKYLTAFEPHPNLSQSGNSSHGLNSSHVLTSSHGPSSSHGTSSSHAPSGTTLDYVEV